jgi:hypothetical protein
VLPAQRAACCSNNTDVGIAQEQMGIADAVPGRGQWASDARRADDWMGGHPTARTLLSRGKRHRCGLAWLGKHGDRLPSGEDPIARFVPHIHLLNRVPV